MKFLDSVRSKVNPLMDRLAEEVGSRPRVAAWIIFIGGLYIVFSILRAIT